MKKIKKNKKIWIKKVFAGTNSYVYCKLESDKVKIIMDRHKKSIDANFWIEKAPFYISIKNNIYDFFIHNKTWDIIKMIIAFTLGILGKYIYDIWF